MSGALSWTPIAVPDFGQALAQQQNLQANRLQMLAAQRQLQQSQQMDEFLAQNAQGFAASDPGKRMNVLAMLAGMGPQGMQVALPQMQQLREEQALTNALPLLGLGGAPASPGAPATSPAPGGTSGQAPGLARPDLIPEPHRAADGYGAHIDPGALRDRLAQRFGLTTAQAAGMVSGLHGESGLRTGIVRPGGADYGLAQWVGPRRRALFAFAEQQGRPAYDPEVQIAFLEREIEQNPRVLAAVRAARDAVGSANAFHNFLSGGAASLEHTRPLHTRAAQQIAAAQAGDLVMGGPRAIPVAAGGGEPPAPTEGRAATPGAAGGVPGAVPAQALQPLAATGGLTAENLARFAIATRGNPTAMRMVQAMAPFVRQGAQTEIKELGAGEQGPAGLYVVNSQTGQRMAYVGPAAESRMQTVDLGAGAPEGQGRYLVENGRPGRRLGDIPPPQTATNINTGERRTETLVANQWENYENIVVDAGRRERLFQRAEQAMQSFSPGQLADRRLWLGGLASQMGLRVDGQGEGEVLRAVQRQLELAATPRGQGQITENERSLIRDTIPVLLSTPQGAREAMNLLRRLDAYDTQIARIYRENARRNGGQPNPVTVREEIAQFVQSNPMPDATAELGGYMQAPAAPAQGGPTTRPISTAPPPPPSVGTVQDGYRFRGGDAGNPASWERVQ